jgi:hypothetical protein
MAGAGLDVWGAQRLAEGITRRRELQDALRQANALIVLAEINEKANCDASAVPRFRGSAMQ